MNKISKYVFFIFLFFGCKTETEIEKYGKKFQLNHDFKSLSKVVELIKLDADTQYVKKILGEPIDMGFDYRYLVDSIGPNGCAIGAVFHINKDGKIDQKWINEICE